MQELLTEGSGAAFRESSRSEQGGWASWDWDTEVPCHLLKAAWKAELGVGNEGGSWLCQ